MIRLWFTKRKRLVHLLREAQIDRDEWEQVAAIRQQESECRGEQLHRVARERDKERKLRLDADDRLFAYYMEKEK